MPALTHLFARKTALAAIGLTAIAALLCLTPLGSGCLDGGWNQNQRQPGNDDDGILVAFGEIAVDPQGKYFLARSGDQLVHGDLLTFGSRVLDGIHDPHRLVFGHDSCTIFITTGACGDLMAYDLHKERVTWRAPLDDEDQDPLHSTHYPKIQVSADDQRIVAAFPTRLVVIDAASGETLRRYLFERRIVDVDLLPDGETVLVTLDHAWNIAGDTVKTRLVFIGLLDGSTQEIVVPNCSDEIVVTEDGKRAFLAPTTCQRDPVSVIDLQNRRFVRNLPGFGPTALSPAGTTAVAFVDTWNIDESLFPEGTSIPDEAEGRYHLMLIDAVTLDFTTMPLGEELPRYALTPDGKMILIDASWLWVEGRIRVLDIDAGTMRIVTGPDVRLEEFVITSDSGRVFLLFEGLHEIAVREASARSIPLDFYPSTINITPDDRYLLLGEYGQRIYAYDIAEGRLVRHLDAPVVQPEPEQL